jgi:hypothetical protein
MPTATENHQVEAQRGEQVSAPEETRGFLEQHLPPELLAVFPDWQGFLLACPEPAISVWVVRTRQDGKRLHRTTGTPALLLEDVLAQRRRPPAEAWQTLLSRLIVSAGNGEKGE